MSGELNSIGARPVVIIGAGRSGTNMLRDVLTRIDGIATWPCDEINYIWRHGNRVLDTDEFSTDQATASVVNSIRGRFASMAEKLEPDSVARLELVLLEKTCANSLRIEFVDKVLPEARYIYIIRDGRDVVASATKRWQAKLDIPYLLAKARYVPLSDLPYYALRYGANRISKLFNPDARLSVWGPRFAGWRNYVAGADLDTLCAVQWARCVERSDEAFQGIDTDRIYSLRYEQFVADPRQHVKMILDFLDIAASYESIDGACSDVNTHSVGGAAQEGVISVDALNAMKPMLTRHGYT